MYRGERREEGGEEEGGKEEGGVKSAVRWVRKKMSTETVTHTYTKYVLFSNTTTWIEMVHPCRLVVEVFIVLYEIYNAFERLGILV